jgi:hypothetical protein
MKMINKETFPAPGYSYAILDTEEEPVLLLSLVSAHLPYLYSTHTAWESNWYRVGRLRRKRYLVVDMWLGNRGKGVETSFKVVTEVIVF